jgi:hypothetical protein
MKKCIPASLVLVILLAVGAMAAGQPAKLPAWWNGNTNPPAGPDETPPPLDDWVHQPDRTAITYGQLKVVATHARDYLNSVLADVGGAGTKVDEALASLNDPTTIPDDSAPAPQAQLQAITQPFYERLVAAGYDTKANLAASGLGADWASNFPWPDPPPGPDDAAYDANAYATWQQAQAAPANLGQLKVDFSFDLDSRTTKVALAGSQAGLSGKSGTRTGDTAGSKAGDDEAGSLDKGKAAVAGGKAGGNIAGSLVDDNAGLALIVLTPLE